MGYLERRWRAYLNEGLDPGPTDFWAGQLENIDYERHAVVRGTGDDAYCPSFFDECDRFRRSYKLTYRRPRNFWPEMLPILQGMLVWRLLSFHDKKLLGLLGEGLGQKAIASRMGVTQGAISTHIRHAMSRIRRLWDCTAWEPSDMPVWRRAGFELVSKFLSASESVYDYCRRHRMSRSLLDNRIKLARKLLERGYAGYSPFGKRLYERTTSLERVRMLSLIRSHKPWARGLHQSTRRIKSRSPA